MCVTFTVDLRDECGAEQQEDNLMHGLLATAALLMWAQETQPPRLEKPKPRKTEAPVLSSRGGLALAYDDNILEMNEKQIDQLEDGTRPGKFKIEDPDEFVTTAGVELELQARLLQEPLTFGLQLEAHLYQESSIANYEEYRLFVKRNFGKHEARIEYSVEWDRYHRELEIVPGSNLWESAYYGEHRIEFSYRHRVSEKAWLRGHLGGVLRDFDSPFEFRDQRGYFLGLRPTVEPVHGWKIFLGYEYKSVESAAGPTEPDTSYDQHEVEPGTSVELMAGRLEISLRHRLALRTYTTGNSFLADPAHVDREDDRQRTILELRIKPGKGWSLDARYSRWVVRSDRPFDIGDSAEELGSRRQVFSIGVSYEF